MVHTHSVTRKNNTMGSSCFIQGLGLYDAQTKLLIYHVLRFSSIHEGS